MAAKFSEDEIERGLDCYDPEHRVFPRFVQSETRGKLTESDVLLILKWKLGRIKTTNASTISSSNLDKINRAIKLASERKLEAIESLEQISGIGLATATAILTLCYPDHFTIIDQRVLEVLELVPPRLEDRRPRVFRAEDWSAEEYLEHYLPPVLAIGKTVSRCLRKTDQALWGISVSRRIDKIIRVSRRQSA
jgi:hypothetical protein